jgi:hypothetical protein
MPLYVSGAVSATFLISGADHDPSMCTDAVLRETESRASVGRDHRLARAYCDSGQYPYQTQAAGVHRYQFVPALYRY